MRTRRMLMTAALLAAAALTRASGATRSLAATPPRPLARATFAGGCFWSMELPFAPLKGVVSVTAGYTGGSKRNPTYADVSAGGTGHLESVDVVYDPKVIGYPQLLDVYWHSIDPTNGDGQFCDLGAEYHTAIFYHDPEQQRLALASKEALAKRMKVTTNIRPAGPFWAAEDEHQHFASRNPVRYKLYRLNCGRDRRLAQLWGAAPEHR